MKRMTLVATGLMLATCLFLLVPTTKASTFGRGNGPIIFVTGQGLYYDSIVVVDPLPARGRFQLLSMGPNGLETQLGPGDRGYVGGRWKEDFDGDGVFHYFECPLLGPGRSAP